MMKVSRGLLLFMTIFLSLAMMNCQWVKACAAPPGEFCNELMWCWTVSAAMLFYLPYVFLRKVIPSLVTIAISYIIFWANLAYLRTYGSWIPIGSYLHTSNLADFSNSVTSSFETIDIVVPLILLTSTFLLCKANITPINRPRILSLSALSLIITVTLFVYPESVLSQINLLKTNHNEHALAVSRYSLPVVLISCIDETPLLNKQNINEIQLAIERRLSPSNLASVSKNLVIVFMESLESWLVGKTVNGKEITPVLNRLAAEPATLFSHKVINQTGAGRSIDAQLLVVSGMLPPKGLVFPFHYPGNNYPSIYKAMKDCNSSQVYSFTTDLRDIYNIGAISKQFGVDSLFVIRDSDSKRRLPDADFFRTAISQIEKGDLWDCTKSKCMQFVTYSCHVPYMFPKNEIAKLPRVEYMSKSLGDYINAVHYTDYSLGILIDYLQTKPDYNQTIIVIIGDHPVFGKERRKDLSAEIQDISEAYVPLLILNAPSGNVNENIPVEQVDVYTTMIRFLGLERYAWHGLGQVIGEKPDSLSFDRNVVSELILAHNLYRKTNQ